MPLTGEKIPNWLALLSVILIFSAISYCSSLSGGSLLQSTPTLALPSGPDFCSEPPSAIAVQSSSHQECGSLNNSCSPCVRPY